MANRTQKAAMKKKADAGKAPKKGHAKDEAMDFEDARAAELLDAESKGKAKGKPAKAKTPKAKGKKGRDKPVEFADEGLIIETPAPEKPGFMARWRANREEKAQARAAEQARKAAERAAEDQRKAEERAAAEEQARKEAEERAAAEQAAAAAAEKERRKEEARAARQAAKDEAARLEAEKEAATEARKEQRRLQRQAERAAIEERERLAAEQAEAEDRRREAEKAAKAAAAAARKAASEPKELEPDLEFETGSDPVDPSRALIPARKEAEKAERGKKGKPESKPTEPAAAGAGTTTDLQAERMAEELARRRSKPVVIVEDEVQTPKLNLREAAGLAQPKDEEATPLVTGEAVVDERYKPDAPLPAPPSGLSIPEMFILAVNEGGWDERIEKAKPGRLGGALAGAIVLELLQRGRVLVQRDRFTVVGESGDDEAVEAAVAKMRSIRERKGDIASLPHMRRMAKWNRELLEPFKDRLAGRGLVQHSHRMHLGLFYRSSVTLLDEDAQERLRNKLRRAIAGGGTPEASSILLLGLLDACGLLPLIVPDEAMDYNRKRLNGLLGGRDIMGYKVDPQLKALQEVAVRTILQNVRAMTG